MPASCPVLASDSSHSDPRLDWKNAATRIVVRFPHAHIRLARVPALARRLQESASHTYWHAYVSPVLRGACDLEQLFFELALSISQFGGFTHFRSDGATEQWKLDGSGVKALLDTMQAIRSAKKLPGVDITSGFRESLAPLLIGKPFAAERIAIMEEVAQNRYVLGAIVREARGGDGSYRFQQRHVLALTDQLPLSFGGDPLFCKKASLLLLTMQTALTDLGRHAGADTIPPADYRIPQILESFGVLAFSPALIAKLGAGHVFARTDREVLATRAATTLAVHLLHRAAKGMDRQVTVAEVDSMLYLLSRDPETMAQVRLPHMKVATLAF